MGGPDRDDHVHRLIATERLLADRIAAAQVEADRIRAEALARIAAADEVAARERRDAVLAVAAEVEQELARRLAKDEAGRAAEIGSYATASQARIDELATMVVELVAGGPAA